MQNSETSSAIMLPTCGDGILDHVLKGFCISLHMWPVELKRITQIQAVDFRSVTLMINLQVDQ